MHRRQRDVNGVRRALRVGGWRWGSGRRWGVKSEGCEVCQRVIERVAVGSLDPARK